MAETSTMRALGSSAPDFSLPDTTSDETISLQDVRDETATVVMFICNHCPYVKHANPGIVALVNDYSAKGIGFVAISANDIEDYPEDSPQNMKEYAGRLGYSFPYLYDETQVVAKAYGAACTPDFFVYDSVLKLAYRGRMDGSSPGNEELVTASELRAALDALLAGELPDQDQKPSIGCSIKWRQ